MARMLGPSDYGVLAFLMSLTYIFAVPTIAIQTGIAKKISKLKTEENYGKMKGLFIHFLKRLLIVSFAIFLVFIIAVLIFADAFETPSEILILTATLIIASFIYPVASGTLQGMKKFSALGWNTVLIFSTKLIIAVVLVIAGLKIYGAIMGFVLSVFLGFFFALPYLKKIFRAKISEYDERLLSRENLLIFSAMLILVLIYSMDVIIAKLFFSNEIVGQYAVLSTVGKIILFSTMSIGNAFFPISAERHYLGKETKGLMKKASSIVAALCIFALIIFYFFSKQILNFLFGSQYLEFSNLLLPVSAAFSTIALINLNLLHKISKEEFKGLHLLLMFVFLAIQAILLSFFSSSIERFTTGFMLSTIITFIGSFILMKKWKK